MKKIFVTVLIMLVCVLVAGYSMPVLAETSAVFAPLRLQVTEVTPEGQMIAVSAGMPVPVPQPGGAVIVIDSNGLRTVLTSAGTIWYDAIGNSWGY